MENYEEFTLLQVLPEESVDMGLILDEILRRLRERQIKRKEEEERA